MMAAYLLSSTVSGVLESGRVKVSSASFRDFSVVSSLVTVLHSMTELANAEKREICVNDKIEQCMFPKAESTEEEDRRNIVIIM